jgi:hypothetical protein
MAKIDKSQYTKEEWRVIKQQRKQEKAQRELEKNLPLSQTIRDTTEDKRYIMCLKHGTKYSADYVNKLYNGVKRHCSLDFEMVCLTDDPKDIHSDIKIILLPAGLTGWWCKPYMFSADLPIKGTILYLDLDVVIASNIDKLFTYQPNSWCTVRDFTRAMRPKWPKYNSSVVRFKAGDLKHVWDEYIKDPVKIQRKYFGDQDYLFEATRNKQATLYPDSWILSWKWEVRKDKQFAPGGVKGNRKLKTIENVIPRVECCICVFHGDPNPHNCDDPWVVDNWR